MMFEEVGGELLIPCEVHASDVGSWATRSPHDEVVPGVAWGRSGWVGSPAYWSMLTATEDPADDYVRRDACPLHHELAFCVLGGYGVRMEINEAAFEACLAQGLSLVLQRRPFTTK